MYLGSRMKIRISKTIIERNMFSFCFHNKSILSVFFLLEILRLFVIKEKKMGPLATFINILDGDFLQISFNQINRNLNFEYWLN